MDQLRNFLDQLWAFLGQHAGPLGIVVGVLALTITVLAWRRPKPTDPPVIKLVDERRDSTPLPAIAPPIEAAKAAGSRFQLPARNPDFVGRREKIEEIKAALRAGAAQVTALEGMGGIGKTDTAIEAAHELAGEGRFADAQLFVDLQGFSATGHPLAPADALRALLRPFVPANEPLPEGELELAGRFREVTQGLQMLLFLDNARDDEQVAPLCPGHSACTVLVTSRNRLSLRGLRPIDLALMDEEEAAALALKLANRRDPRRITQAHAATIARLCGCLPLSIEVTANALSKSQGADVARYLKALGERTKPLKALERAKAVLRLSVEVLDAETRARWAALGVFEGGFDAVDAAEVWELEEAGATLDELEQRSLVSFEAKARRYHLHDLLRAVALEELARDPAREHEAVARHAGHFFAVLRTADALYRAGHDDVGRGLALLDAELANIRAAQRWACGAMAEDEQAAELAQDFHHQCLMLRFAPDEHLAWLETSLAAAKRRGDREGQARAAGNLGLIYQTRGELDRAEEMYKQSLEISEAIGHKELNANQYGNLGLIYRRRGELDRAEEMHRKSLAIATELGRKEGMAANYGNLGLIYRTRGELDRAGEMHHKSLANEQELGRKEGMAAQYGNLGLIYRMRGELDRAEEMHHKCLAINEELGRKEGMAANYGNLGSLYEQRGDMGRAVAYWRRSLALNREIGARPEIEKVSGWLREAGVDPDRDAAAE